MLAYTVYDFRKPFKGIIKEKDPEIKVSRKAHWVHMRIVSAILEEDVTHITLTGDSSIFRMVVGPTVHWSENRALVRMVNSPTGR